MKENESKLIPINQLNQVSQRLDSKLHLPDWIDTDQIGINLGCTERLMNLGGIRKISLIA